MKGGNILFFIVAVVIAVLVTMLSMGRTTELRFDCTSDSDCMLIDRELSPSRCWQDACTGIDYSLERYIAVNQASGQAFLEKNRPTELLCGPAPQCPSYFINRNFAAKCIENSCKKVPQ